MKIILPSIVFTLLQSAPALAGLRKHKKHKGASHTKVETFNVGITDNGNQKQTHININQTNNYNTNIVGGDNAGSNEFPWFVDLNGCGASLIAPNVVLTAAHCDESGSNLINQFALVGAYERWDDSNYGQKIRISDQKIHPGYDSSSVNNDFQLLKLSQSVTNTVVEINSSSSNPNTSNGGTRLTVIGVGATSEGGSQANRLQKVDVDSVSSNQCNNILSGYGGITENMFCAGDLNGGKDSCQGDSGGPIVDQNNVQVGVVSWGIGCARPDLPGVYATVSSAYGWIKGVVCDDWGISDAELCGGSGGGGGGGGDSGGGNCQNDELKFDLAITTDEYGYETSWEVKDSKDDVMARGEDYGNDQTNQEQKCFAKDECYTLTIYDDYGDGLCCGQNPGYKVVVDGNTIAEARAEDFGDKISFTFGSCGGGGGGGGGDPQCLPLNLLVRTDSYGEEVTIKLINDVTEEYIWHDWDLDSNKDHTYNACINPSGCHQLEVWDSWGDGLIEGGFIRVALDGNKEYEGGDYGPGLIKRFGTAC